MAHPADRRSREEGSGTDPGAYRTPVAVPGFVPGSVRAAWEEDGGMEGGRPRRTLVRVGGMALLACAEEAEAKNRS